MTEKYKKIQTDHFKTINELIETCKMWIREDDYDAYYRFFEFNCMKELINLIQTQQKEIELLKEQKQYVIDEYGETIEKKDKIINLMCDWLVGFTFSDNNEPENIFNNKEEVKQYFEKKVEENNGKDI